MQALQCAPNMDVDQHALVGGRTVLIGDNRRLRRRRAPSFAQQRLVDVAASTENAAAMPSAGQSSAARAVHFR